MKHLRADFPFLHDAQHTTPLIYFDNAATTQKPQVVIDTISKFYAYQYANVGRGVYARAEQATQMYEDARVAIARFIGAQYASEVVFTSSATESINTVARAWAYHNIHKGDEIVVSELEHHSNLVVWQECARERQAILKFIPIDATGDLQYDTLSSVITDKTKLVTVTNCSNALGTIVDVARIRTRARQVGARLLVDAAQMIPHRRIYVESLGCDFLVFSGHKMLGPSGSGVLYVNKSLHKTMQPSRVGGGMVFDVSCTRASWQGMPHMLEAGSPAVAQAVGLHAAIKYLTNHVDCDTLSKHEAALCERTIAGLHKIKGITVLGPVEQLKKHGHTVSFTVDGVHPHDVAAYLDQHGICVRAGHHCAQPLAQKLGIDGSVRVSFYLYNTLQEVDKLLDVLSHLTA